MSYTFCYRKADGKGTVQSAPISKAAWANGWARHHFDHDQEITMAWVLNSKNQLVGDPWTRSASVEDKDREGEGT